MGEANQAGLQALIQVLLSPAYAGLMVIGYTTRYRRRLPYGKALLHQFAATLIVFFVAAAIGFVVGRGGSDGAGALALIIGISAWCGYVGQMIRKPDSLPIGMGGAFGLGVRMWLLGVAALLSLGFVAAPFGVLFATGERMAWFLAWLVCGVGAFCAWKVWLSYRRATASPDAMFPPLHQEVGRAAFSAQAQAHGRFDAKPPRQSEQEASNYLRALSEAEGAERVEALWVKAYAETDGDPVKQKAYYIRERVKEMAT